MERANEQNAPSISDGEAPQVVIDVKSSIPIINAEVTPNASPSKSTAPANTVSSEQITAISETTATTLESTATTRNSRGELHAQINIEENNAMKRNTSTSVGNVVISNTTTSSITRTTTTTTTNQIGSNLPLPIYNKKLPAIPTKEIPNVEERATLEHASASSCCNQINRMQMKGRICQVVERIDSSTWCFQKNVEKLSRLHLCNLLFDCYLENNSACASDKQTQDVKTTIHCCYQSIMEAYQKWCRISSQGESSSPSIAIFKKMIHESFHPSSGVQSEVNDGSVAQSARNNLTRNQQNSSPSVVMIMEDVNIHVDDVCKVADMLLLLMVWREIDILRSQNNIVHLLFHACRRCIQKEFTINNVSTSKSNASMNKHTSIGEFLRYEANFLYQLVRQVGFNRVLRNEHFVAWDDLNCTCVTPGFVKRFMDSMSFKDAFTFKDDSIILASIVKEIKKQPKVNSSNHCGNNIQEKGDENIEKNHQNILNHVSKENKDSRTDVQKSADSHTDVQESANDYQIIDVKGSKIDGEVKISETMQKDGTDGPERDEESVLKLEKSRFIGTWKTYFDRAGGWQGWRGYLTMMTNFIIPIYAQLIFLSIMLYLLIEFPSFKTKPIYVLPLCGVPLLMVLFCAALYTLILKWRTKPWKHPFVRTIPRRDAAMDGSLRRSYKLNYLLWFFVMISQFVAVRYMVFDNLHKATRVVVYQISTNKFSVLSIIALILSWIPVFFIYWTVTPVVFTIWKSIFAFIYAWMIGMNRLVSYGDFKKALRSQKTLVMFKDKLLGPMNRNLPLDSVRYRFAILFNCIIDEFYEDHICSHTERRRLSFDLTDFEHKKIISEDEFQEQLKRITTVRPQNQEFCLQMIKWMNNLYMSMPMECSVESMKRLVILTPVYKESILYSWRELTSLTNTNTTFLHHLIKKYPMDWNNFKNYESNYRDILTIIEQKVKSNSEVSHIGEMTIPLTNEKNFTLENKVKEQQYGDIPPEVIEKIRFWAGDRFQPVSRTVRGMLKIVKALRMLVRIQCSQNMEYSDQEIEEIVKQKFCLICGAQVLDPSIWKPGEDNSQYRDDFTLLLKKYGGDYFKIAFQKRVNNQFVGVLASSVKQNGDIVEEYTVDMFGKFDSMGQGKPTHQSFALQFFDGSIIEAIDCNQSAVLPHLFFLPNALAEFTKNKRLKILGFPEYIFTSSWSDAGFGAAFTEKVFGTIIQRSWAMLGMRMHYGHPDFLDGIWVMFTTGMSNLSYVSEDVFTGFDTILCGGEIGYVDYYMVGKARDVCLFTTSKFNRKIAGGAAQVAVCRYLREIMDSYHFTIAEKMTLAYTTIAHYFNTVLIIMSTLILFFIRIIVLALRLFEMETMDEATSAVWSVIDYVFFVQVGAALSIPGFLQLVLDHGLWRAVLEYFVKLKFILISIYSVFHLLNTSLYFHYGFVDAAQYLASGRGAGLDHENLSKIIAAFDSSHFVPSIILFLYSIVGLAVGGSLSFFIYNVLMGGIWLLSPFLFNRGSFPFGGVSYRTWVQLYSKDMAYVKKWKVRHIISELARRTKNLSKISRSEQLESSEERLDNMIAWINIDRYEHDSKFGYENEDGLDSDLSGGISTSTSTESISQMTTHLENQSFSTLLDGLESGGRLRHGGYGEQGMMNKKRKQMHQNNVKQYHEHQIESEEDEKLFKYQQQKKFGNRIRYKLSQIRESIRSITWNFFLLLTLCGIKYSTLLIGFLKFINPLAVPSIGAIHGDTIGDLKNHVNERRFIELQHHVKMARREGKEFREKASMLQRELEKLQRGVCSSGMESQIVRNLSSGDTLQENDSKISHKGSAGSDRLMSEKTISTGSLMIDV